VVYPSEFIGRPFGSVNGQGVTALTDAQICVFNRRDFDAFAREHPALEHKLLDRTLAELDRTRRWMLPRDTNRRVLRQTCKKWRRPRNGP